MTTDPITDDELEQICWRSDHIVDERRPDLLRLLAELRQARADVIRLTAALAEVRTLVNGRYASAELSGAAIRDVTKMIEGALPTAPEPEGFFDPRTGQVYPERAASAERTGE